MSLTSDLVELSQHLQHEHLFVSTEREQLQRLYQSVTLLSERLFHNAWIARQQKVNLQQYIDQGTNAGESFEVYTTNNQLESTNFVDSYKVFSYHDTKYGELLKFLYENPNLVAYIISEAEKLSRLNVPRMISLMVTSIYGNCIFQEDEQAVLRLLKALLDSQLANSENPRRLIRRQNMSFSLVYKHYCESLFSARLFLTAALYDPIMRLLMEDEWFFDIDPDKAMVRFPPAEKLRRFGEPGTEEHAQKLAQYRSYIVDKLVFLAVRFINSIKANIHCFPPSLGWLVSQVYRVLTERGQVSMQEVRASCADLVFPLFICPAICDPEPHGITSDVPISHIARHNLMQMAQIIQVLAISQWEEIDPKVKDLYGKFEKGCMSSVLDLFLEGPWEDITEQQTAVQQSQGTGATRSAVLLMSGDVRQMIGFLRNSTCQLDEKTPNKKQLEQLLSALPADMPPSAADNLSMPGGSGVITPSSGLPGSADSPGTPTSDRKSLKSRIKKKKSVTNAPALDALLADPQESEAATGGDVLVISIYPPGDCPGMLSEKKVLSSMSETETKKNSPLPSQPSSTVTTVAPQAPPNPEIQEKRTRFSLSHDQESIGNASDYQEVISEAASSHSVEDENELETDNFSDMMSANVSGRGSPSISGRDTPLSQAGSVEENPPAPQLPVPVPETVRKENRVDVTERFGKFEIKAELAMERDECKSTVSDTWSTDVLASDSEPPEQNQVDRLEEVAEEISRPLLLGSEPLSEISETASDAWSTDVLASDTDEKHSELLKDLEQDLISGDANEGEGSIGQEEGEDHSELDQLGAVGGGLMSQLSQESNEQFAFVYPDSTGKPGDDADRSSNGKKISSIVHHFQSGPNLQLPTIHRLPSQSLKHAEGKVSSALSTFEGNTSGATSAVQSSTGARSKVQDKKSRESRGSQGGGDDGLEFDPLAPSVTSLGGRRKSRDKWPWSKSGKNSYDQQGTNLPSNMEPHQTLPQDLSLTAGRGGRTSSRDSGIDIWVNTNGQMSGSSSRSAAAALMNARSSLDSSLRHSHPVPLPGRSSLDSNLQRLHSIGGMSSNTDSGIQSLYISPNTSLDTNTPPLEMDNPLFNMNTPSDSPAKNNSNNNDFIFTNLNEKKPSSPVSKEPLLIMDSAVVEENLIHAAEGDVYKNRKLRRNTPQIEVTDIFKKISIIKNEGEPDDQAELGDVPNMGEQQISNLNERRLSCALVERFDPFSVPGEDFDTPSADVIDSSVLSADVFKLGGAEPLTDGRKSAEPESLGQHRRDSIGSNISGSSLKMTTAADTVKEPSPDSVSLVSDKDVTDGEKQKKSGGVGFLRTVKDKINRGIKRKNTKFDKDIDPPENDNTTKQTQGASASKDSAASNQETTDDILAKYRTPKKQPAKPGANSNNSNSSATGPRADSTDNVQSGSSVIPSRATMPCSTDSQNLEESHVQILDLDHLETCPAFLDAKRKLRLVLSMGDVYFGIGQIQSSSPREGCTNRGNELINILTAQLAEAINLQNKDLVAQLYEALRCIKMFDSDGCKKLLRSMREDYCTRSAYIAYLVRCRQGLLATRHQLQRLLSRISREKEICSKHLTNICARNFLEKREKRLWKFITEFQKLSMSDEKIDLVEQFLQQLYQEMVSDPLWKAATDNQLEDGKQAIERFLMSRIYTHAMFPNGDGDILRDQLLQEHLRKLSKIITPTHKDLRIPRMYHLECPWPAAQKEIYMINAYRTPKDKIQCVLRCSQTIMNLLSMANEKSVPAADDFMPVLIFVLIKANPFGLLSTIQYVNSFYESRLHGEEQYWWLQLTSAVEFIKTMEYST
ncbi:GTPase-activating protein and VPS9 domain-containing protein 1-like isoform X2 [Physella acuta]|uniref:GTPase-activating protein and VPS9 domain-containing protein 1-like isoform X2 n=1 Tax=Physella acuta TaxID=109671 RepID=UPI0027DDD352|nr:GTPase-activating protein and VPS9 domain-containing protein 1-like isoform X2 [Physella acuta]